MKWKIWKEKYYQIAKKLNLDPQADLRAAQTLDELLPQPEIDELLQLIRNKRVLVCGAANSIIEDLKRAEELGYLKDTIIAADGATSAVLAFRRPDVIVTDLDGYVPDQLRAWKEGAWMVVHAHGDNIELLRTYVPQLKERVIGTTQLKPFGKLFNFGGFTDGDRAAFLAHELGARLIYLAGMDPDAEVGILSGRKDHRQKRMKLQICKSMLSWLSELGANISSLNRPL